MNKRTLAAQLRHRQIAHTDTVPRMAHDLASELNISYDEALAQARMFIERAPDDAIIGSYIVCPGCGQPIIDARTNAMLIWRAHDAQEWIDLTAAWAKRHAETNESEE
jgi:hypothetical protein